MHPSDTETITSQSSPKHTYKSWESQVLSKSSVPSLQPRDKCPKCNCLTQELPTLHPQTPSQIQAIIYPFMVQARRSKITETYLLNQHCYWLPLWFGKVLEYLQMCVTHFLIGKMRRLNWMIAKTLCNSNDTGFYFKPIIAGWENWSDFQQGALPFPPAHVTPSSTVLRCWKQPHLKGGKPAT